MESFSLPGLYCLDLTIKKTIKQLANPVARLIVYNGVYLIFKIIGMNFCLLVLSLKIVSYVQEKNIWENLVDFVPLSYDCHTKFIYFILF
jgi:hypothetical protein